MNARRNIETTGAILFSALAFFGSTPNVQATDYLNPNQNPANKLAKRFVKQIGGQILHMARNGEGDQGASSINPSGAATVTLIVDTERSLVPGSNGKYTFEAFADKTGSNGLDRSDINSVRVAEGSSPSDDRPLFALRVSTPHSHSHAPNEGGARFWYGAQGTAVDSSDTRVVFNGSAYPSRFSTPPELVLNRTEIDAAGQTMERVINAALSGQPTHLEEPPFGPLQHVN
jgi:hypothetical protein